MVHPALLRPSAPATAGGRPHARNGPAGGLPDGAKSLLRRLVLRGVAHYRPELHYMRGGRTAGAKSLAAAG